MIDEASTPMLLTFVYASTYLVRCRDLWAQLVALNELDKAWTVMGDFNAILNIDNH